MDFYYQYYDYIDDLNKLQYYLINLDFYRTLLKLCTISFMHT